MQTQILITFLAVLLSSLLVFASAAPPNYDARALIPRVDLCAHLNVNIFAALKLPKATGRGELDVCLCASTLPLFIKTNIYTSAAAGIVGKNAVIEALLKIITSGGHQCIYPAHALSACSSNDLCDFTCIDGYSRVGNACVCASPKVECNDKCQSGACSSSVPQNPSKRSFLSPSYRSRMRILTEERCPRGHRLCGRESALGKRDDAWECIDTRNTLESCGGCMHHYYLDGHPVDGTDCSALPGVSDVQCYSGRCLVHRCKRGWTISPSGTECLLAVETF